EGVDADPHLLSGTQRRHLALGHVATEFQRIVLHQAEHHRARPDVVAGIDQPGRHRSLEGRANRHPIELDAELVASGTGHLQGRPDLFVLLRRDDPLGAQRAGARLVRHRFLETGLRLAETRLGHVAAHARQHLVAAHTVTQVGIDDDHLTLDLAREIRLRVRRERAHDRHHPLDRARRHARDGDRDRLGPRLARRRLGARATVAAGRRQKKRRMESTMSRSRASTGASASAARSTSAASRSRLPSSAARWRSSLVGKYRYTVPFPTPARDATSLTRTRWKSRSANTVVAAVRMRCRLVSLRIRVPELTGQFYQSAPDDGRAGGSAPAAPDRYI